MRRQLRVERRSFLRWDRLMTIGSLCTLEMFDSHGDGWQGNEFNVNGQGGFTLTDGSYGTATFRVAANLPPPLATLFWFQDLRRSRLPSRRLRRRRLPTDHPGLSTAEVVTVTMQFAGGIDDFLLQQAEFAQMADELGVPAEHPPRRQRPVVVEAQIAPTETYPSTIGVRSSGHQHGLDDHAKSVPRRDYGQPTAKTIVASSPPPPFRSASRARPTTVVACPRHRYQSRL